MMFSLRYWLQRILFILVGAGLFLYFAINFLYGEHGLYASREKQRILAQDQKTLAQTQAEEEHWQRRVGSLKEKSLDPDVLDARARLMLNLTGQDDVILLRSNNGPLF